MLKTITIILLALGLMAMAACEENPAKEYGTTVVRTIDRADRAADSANLAALKQSVQAYYAANGRYPESLDELGIGIDSSHFDYDPATGTVTIKN
jgi:hypothetical protein